MTHRPAATRERPMGRIPTPRRTLRLFVPPLASTLAAGFLTLAISLPPADDVSANVGPEWLEAPT